MRPVSEVRGLLDFSTAAKAAAIFSCFANVELRRDTNRSRKVVSKLPATKASSRISSLCNGTVVGTPRISISSKATLIFPIASFRFEPHVDSFAISES